MVIFNLLLNSLYNNITNSSIIIKIVPLIVLILINNNKILLNSCVWLLFFSEFDFDTSS